VLAPCTDRLQVANPRLLVALLAAERRAENSDAAYYCRCVVDELARIRLAIERLSSLTASISEAQTLGFGPGTVGSMWSREFHKKAVQVYCLTLPWTYLREIAYHFEEAFDAMLVREAPDRTARDWVSVGKYFFNFAAAVDEFAPPSVEIDVRELPALQPSSPGLIRFGILAEIATTSGVLTLNNACDSLLDVLGRSGQCPLDPLSLDVIRKIGRGEKVADIAQDVGLAERSVYRLLKAAWRELGVSSRAEGLTYLADRRWLSAASDSRLEIE